MRKILLTTMIAGVLVAPIASAQVSVGVGGGGGIGVNAGSIGAGASGRTDVGATTRASRLDKRVTGNADAQVQGNVVSETARAANGAAQAGADTAAGVGSTVRGTARAGAQAATNASGIAAV